VPKVDVVVLPGVGNYYGWKFEGGVDHLFNKAFHAILRKITEHERKYSFIVLDLTHGVNFQTISVLYATIAATVTSGIENRVILLNSEPIGTRRKKSNPSNQQNESSADDLNILDVTRLQEIIRLIRTLRNVTELNPLNRRVIKELKEMRSPNNGALTKILRLTSLLSNNIIALTYPNTYCLERGKERAIGLENNPCPQLLSDDVHTKIGKPSYEPKINSEEKTVTYEEASVYNVLDTALQLIAGQTICNELLKDKADEDFITYLKNSRNLLKNKGHMHSYLITGETLKELNLFKKIILECPEENSTQEICATLRNEVKRQNEIISIPSHVLEYLYINKHVLTGGKQNKERKKKENDINRHK